MVFRDGNRIVDHRSYLENSPCTPIEIGAVFFDSISTFLYNTCIDNYKFYRHSYICVHNHMCIYDAKSPELATSVLITKFAKYGPKHQLSSKSFNFPNSIKTNIWMQNKLKELTYYKFLNIHL